MRSPEFKSGDQNEQEYPEGGYPPELGIKKGTVPLISHIVPLWDSAAGRRQSQHNFLIPVSSGSLQW